MEQLSYCFLLSTQEASVPLALAKPTELGYSAHPHQRELEEQVWLCFLGWESRLFLAGAKITLLVKTLTI